MSDATAAAKATKAAAASSAPSPLDDPGLDRSSWFVSLLSRPNVQRISVARTYALQTLLVRAVTAIPTSPCHRKNTSMPKTNCCRSGSVPAVAQLLLSAYQLSLYWPEQRLYFLLL